MGHNSVWSCIIEIDDPLLRIDGAEIAWTKTGAIGKMAAFVEAELEYSLSAEQKDRLFVEGKLVVEGTDGFSLTMLELTDAELS
jgi:hypothetical protein